MAQILQSLSYKVCSITLPNFNTVGLFIVILGASTIMDQTACCYNVTTSETGLLADIRDQPPHPDSLKSDIQIKSNYLFCAF